MSRVFLVGALAYALSVLGPLARHSDGIIKLLVVFAPAPWLVAFIATIVLAKKKWLAFILLLPSSAVALWYHAFLYATFAAWSIGGFAP